MVDPAALYDRIGELERELEATQHELVRVQERHADPPHRLQLAAWARPLPQWAAAAWVVCIAGCFAIQAWRLTDGTSLVTVLIAWVQFSVVVLVVVLMALLAIFIAAFEWVKVKR
jgi:hypothetical protein